MATGKATAVEEALNIARDIARPGRKLREPTLLESMRNRDLAQRIQELNQLGPKMPTEMYMAERAAILEELNKPGRMMMMDPRVSAKNPVDLGPGAKMQSYLMPDGTIKRVELGRPAPRGGQPLNKTTEEIEAMLPPAREVPKPAPAQDPAITAAIESAEAARAAKAATAADEAAVLAQRESNASLFGPPSPGARPAPTAAPTTVEASPAWQAYQAGSPSRSAWEAGTPGKIALGTAGVAIPAGAMRDSTVDQAKRILTGGRPYMDEGRDAYNAVLGPVSREGWPVSLDDLTQVPEMPKQSPAATVSPAFSQFGFNAFRQNTAPTYTGDAVDAEALTQKYGTRAPAPAAAPSRAAPIPQRPQREEPGFLARALSKVYDPRYLEDKSSRDLYVEAQRMGSAGDEYGANLMNIRAADRARREMPEERASGGATKPNKEASLHKALEIIHMMLSRR